MLTTVVVNLYHPDEEMPAEERERGLDNMIEVGLDTLVESK